MDTPEPHQEGLHAERDRSHGVVALAIGSLGVVFGDIGTSPLYTYQECLGPHGKDPALTSTADIMSVASLIFWALMLVVTFKYVLVLMKADNKGEGGIMALMALVPPEQRAVVGGRIGWVSLLVIAGCSLLFGDGIITPAISVLSAIEGLGTADPRLTTCVVPLTIVILLGLFAIQSRGTGMLGKLFGPVMVVWFVTIGVMGAASVIQTPRVAAALSPMYALDFFFHHGFRGLIMLGSVVMAITGGEALYADMGHFGKTPIRVSWLGLVFPSLVLCYFGQAALVMRHPEALSNPFYELVPGAGMKLALVILSAAATVIASQGLISAVFSLTHQAIRLGYFPRVEVRHTSSEVEGQIYLPAVNWTLAAACLGLVLIFQASARLAAAFGLAVSGTMAITSIVFFSATRYSWKWPVWKSTFVLLLFLSFDIPFFLGTCVKFFDGGYIPFLVGAIMFTIMTIWCSGRSLLREYHDAHRVGVDELVKEMADPKMHRSFDLGVYLSSSRTGLPPVLVQQMQAFETLPHQIVLLSVTSESVPFVLDDRRIEVEKLAPDFYRLICHCGFMEMPNVPALLTLAAPQMELTTPPNKAIYLIGKEGFLATDLGKMGSWSEHIFSVLSRNAVDTTYYFKLPPERVVELGLRVDL